MLMRHGYLRPVWRTSSLVVLVSTTLVVGCATSAGITPAAEPIGQSDVAIGVTVSLDRLAQAKQAGFEYAEMSTTEIAQLSEEEFHAARQRIREIGLPVPVTNLFIPGHIKLTGPDVDPEQQLEYVRRAFNRTSQLGVKYVVFGSGGARRVPDDFPRDRAFTQLVEFAKRVAPEAWARGITILVEPLRRQETNIINSAREGFALVRAVDHPNFQLMVDFYHLASENEDPQILIDARDYIHHLHMANPQGRRFPRNWEEEDYAPFFRALRQTGYSKRISIEANTEDMVHEGPITIQMMRQAFDASFPIR